MAKNDARAQERRQLATWNETVRQWRRNRTLHWWTSPDLRTPPLMFGFAHPSLVARGR